MNKTISINLAGIVYNIDEQAFKKLDKYLETISSYFSEADGKKDIMSDIESRIAEMFQERMGKVRSVVSEDDVDHVISVMGQPEDYLQDPDEAPEEEPEVVFTSKRLFRDPDNRIMGGVCSGIGHYFGFDPVILRIIFVLTFIFVGSGLLIYLILWAIIPKASTASDKLQMKGKAVTVDNIKRRVQEEADQVKKKINDSKAPDSIKQFSNEAQNFIGSIFNFLGNILGYILKFAGGAFGLLLLLGSSISFMLIVGMLLGGEGSISFSDENTYIQTSFHQLALYLLENDTQYYMLSFGIALVSLLPIALILVLGLKLLGTRYKFKYFLLAMLGAWVVGIGLLISSGANLQREYWSDAQVQSNIAISPLSMDTIIVGVNKKEDWYEEEDHFFLVDQDKAQISGVRFDILRSPNDSIYINVTRRSKGRSMKDAKERAKAIDFGYQLMDNSLRLDPFFTVYQDNKWREQELHIDLLLPEGKSVYLDKGTEKVIWDIKNTSNTLDSSMPLKTWSMTPQGLNCSSC